MYKKIQNGTTEKIKPTTEGNNEIQNLKGDGEKSRVQGVNNESPTKANVSNKSK